LIELRQRLQQPSGQHDVTLTYVTARGPWYGISWKGDPEKSGGVATNIGIHLFDLLLWLFGEAGECRVYHASAERMSGFLELERARVRWFLSVEASDLPFALEPGKRSTFRSIQMDEGEIEFTEGFTDLHTRVYEETLAGRGFGIDAARPSVALVHRIRQQPVQPLDALAHPYLTDR
jgi:UDP-N-acetyl-2-amino-2-deoxyglucuronate dehydrogenase